MIRASLILLTILFTLVAHAKVESWSVDHIGHYAGTYEEYHEMEGTGPHSTIHVYSYGAPNGEIWLWACVITRPSIAAQPDISVISRLEVDLKSSIATSLDDKRFRFVILTPSKPALLYDDKKFYRNKSEEN